MCRVWFSWLPEGLSDPINCLSRSALARVLFFYERDSIQICHSLGDAFFSMNSPPLNDELSSFRLRPEKRHGQAKPLPA